MSKMTDKQKLTLSVNSLAVDKARKLDINISEVTEDLLNGLTVEPVDGDYGETITQYKEILKKTLPMLKKFHAHLQIGTIFEDIEQYKDQESKVYLSYDGSIYIETFYDDYIDMFDKLEAMTAASLDKRHVILANPETLLKRLITAIGNASERQKSEAKELIVVGKIIDKISESVLSDSNAGKRLLADMPNE